MPEGKSNEAEIVTVESGLVTTRKGGRPVPQCPKCATGRLYRALIRPDNRWTSSEWLLCSNPDCGYAQDASGRWTVRAL